MSGMSLVVSVVLGGIVSFEMGLFLSRPKRLPEKLQLKKNGTKRQLGKRCLVAKEGPTTWAWGMVKSPEMKGCKR